MEGAHSISPLFLLPLVLTKCQAEANSGGVHPGRFRPQCDENGDYLPKQCNASTGYCWCSYKNGTKIEGTATREELDCEGRWPGRGRRAMSSLCGCCSLFRLWIGRADRAESAQAVGSIPH